jgi:hypothetical protein
VRGARERPAVEEVLAVDGDRLRAGVLRVGPQQVGGGQVGLVAERGEARDAHRTLLQEQAELERDVAALGDEPDRAGRHRRGGELQPLGGVRHSQAVGPEEHRAGRPDARHERRLPRRALDPQLREPRRDGHEGLGAGGQGVVHRRLEPDGRDREHHEVDRLPDVGQAAVGRLAEHRLAAAVDQVHRPRVAVGQRLGADPVAVLRRVVARADHGDRPRREQWRQIARGCGRPADFG